MSKNDLTESDVDEYVIVWQDMEFNYHRVTGSRVFTDFDSAEKINKSLYHPQNAQSSEVMRKRDFDYIQKQQRYFDYTQKQQNNDNDETNKKNA